MSPAAQAQAHPVVAIAAFAEPLVRGRRVAVLGEATLPLGEALLDRGARLVHVYDPDAGRVAEALASRSGRQGPVVAELTDDLGVRDGAFDVVFVPDLPLLGDAPSVVRRVSRLLAGSGVAVFASPNPEAERFLLPPSPAMDEALGYYDLYDVVAVQFSEVRMLGQAPFAGYSIVDFSEPDPEVAVDTSVLEEPEAPEWYVVIASQRRVELEAYSIVEIPLADVSRAAALDGVRIEPTTTPYRAVLPDSHPHGRELFSDSAPKPQERSAEPDRNILALTEAQTRLAVVSTENEKLRERVAELGGIERQLSHASMRAAELEKSLQEAQSKATELEAVAARAESRAESAEGQLLQLRSELETARADLEAAREEPATPRREVATQAERARAARFEAELGVAQSRIQELERQLAAIEPKTLRSREEHAKQLAEARAALTQAEQRGRALEAKLADAEAAQRKAQEELAAAKAERDAALAQAAEASAALESAPADAENAFAADIAALEDQLRERGREVVKLQRELREGERVGKELLFELESLRVIPPHFSREGGPPGGAPSGPAAGSNGSAAAGQGGLGAESSSAAGAGASTADGATPSDPERETLDARATELAERAARVEADLVAASWRIAQLEREAAERGAPDHNDRSQKERELERALVLAQREIAELRAMPRLADAPPQ